MSNIQKTLDALQPYVIGIRYLEGVVLVDVVFKEGWSVLEDPTIKKVKGNEELNYYMVFSEVDNVGLDELLAYIDKTIKFNLERERKHELLKLKVNELKEVFKKNSLVKLSRLQFTFGEEELIPDIGELDLNPIENEELIESKSLIENEPVKEINIEDTNPKVNILVDENGNKIELTPEDIEAIEEEERAKINRKFLETKKLNGASKVNNKKIELPPKKKVEMMVTHNYEDECDCGPDEACSKCIDKK